MALSRVHGSLSTRVECHSLAGTYTGATFSLLTSLWNSNLSVNHSLGPILILEQVQVLVLQIVCL